VLEETPGMLRYYVEVERKDFQITLDEQVPAPIKIDDLVPSNPEVNK
jgi:hypothetical protein